MNAVQPAVAFLPGKGTLSRALARAFGDEATAEAFLEGVLGDAGMDLVPEGRVAFEAFVREEVLPRLVPLVRLEQLHDLVRRTIGEEGSVHPPPVRSYGALGAYAPPAGSARAARRARVVLVESDSFRRIAISRELVRAGFDVEAIPSAEAVLAVDAFHVLILALDAAGEALVRELSRRGTRAGLVILDDPSKRAIVRELLATLNHDRVALVAPDATPATLAARVRVVVG
jgi:hypothetical protein